MLSNNGLGAYPTDPYYDSNRPSWLPYWLDSITESTRKWTGYTPSVQDIQNQQVETLAKTDPVAAAALVTEITRQRSQDQTKTCQWYQTRSDDDTCQLGGGFLWAAVLGTVLTLLITLRKR